MGLHTTQPCIRHLLPSLGLVEIPIYPPADKLLGVLKRNKEDRRLWGLRHLGALTHALPGARHTRWDYTVAMLHYSSSIRTTGSKASFRIGNIDFSSLPAALQCAALIWNIGHLPGTFSVEKGVYRYLLSKNASKPADSLDWPQTNDNVAKQIRDSANAYLKENDYHGLARVLAVLKLLTFAEAEDSWYREWLASFGAPFLLKYGDAPSHQWDKISIAFPIIRHCAYLTMDYAISGLTWGPNVPGLLESVLSQSSRPLNDLLQIVAEVLSPVEHQMYKKLYHHEAARTEAAVVSDHIFKHLIQKPDPSKIISSWLGESLFHRLGIGRIQPRHSHRVAATMTLRSHLSSTPDSASGIEEKLRNKGFELPIVFEYQAWSSDTVLEPDELIIDVMTSSGATTGDVGKLLAWWISEFEDFFGDPKEELVVLRKIEMSNTYLGLLEKRCDWAFLGLLFASSLGRSKN